MIGGADIGKISHITLDQPINGHHFFTIVCPLKEQANTLLNMGSQYIGKDITISLNPGYNRIPGKMKFSGFVTNVKLSKHESALMQIIIQGFSPTRLMDDGPHYQSWKEQTLPAIADVVAGKYEIKVSNDITHTEPLPYVNQYRESSFRFLQRMMANFGQWCYYDGEQLVLGTPIEEGDINLTFGREMSALDLSADIVPADFKLLGYNYVDDQHFDVEGNAATVSEVDQLGNVALSASTEVFTNKPLHVEPFYSTSKADLEEQARRRRSGQAAQFVNLFGQTSHLGLKLGEVIVVRSEERTTGLGALGGDYGRFRIVHITHSVDGTGQYSNNIQAIPAGLLMPPFTDASHQPVVAETQPAEVIDNRDPDGLGRVQVQFPWQKEEGETTPWIRVSSAGAGGGHGSYFVPEIGDQVLVGFTWNNPDRPLVVGSLYNATTKHANAANPDNNTKIIKTRADNRITLSDANGEEMIKIENGDNVITMNMAGDTSITIETPGDLILKGKTVAITAETSFTLNSETSTMTSSKETDVIAQGEMSLSATKNMSLASQMDVSIDATKKLGMSGLVKAELNSATIDVNGSALVNVMSAMVKLN